MRPRPFAEAPQPFGVCPVLAGVVPCSGTLLRIGAPVAEAAPPPVAFSPFLHKAARLPEPLAERTTIVVEAEKAVTAVALPATANTSAATATTNAGEGG